MEELKADVLSCLSRFIMFYHSICERVSCSWTLSAFV